eukprot:c11436_g1_i4.p1 GENE.c11436_g1_i4~~c11436_g1_i4.p1  ORF type:complete len:217 (-),score=34.83 c11436_g1_i4:42-692(-)
MTSSSSATLAACAAEQLALSRRLSDVATEASSSTSCDCGICIFTFYFLLEALTPSGPLNFNGNDWSPEHRKMKPRHRLGGLIARHGLFANVRAVRARVHFENVRCIRDPHCHCAFVFVADGFLGYFFRVPEHQFHFVVAVVAFEVCWCLQHTLYFPTQNVVADGNSVAGLVVVVVLMNVVFVRVFLFCVAVVIVGSLAAWLAALVVFVVFVVFVGE